MRIAFESGSRKTFRPGDAPRDVAALLKRHLRTMCEPLLTFDLYATFIAAVGSAAHVDDAAAADSTRRANVHTTLLLLPAANAALLADLCGFLHATAYAHPHPRDAVRGLAAAFAGLIGRDSAPTLEGVLSDAPFAILLTAILIEHHRSLFSAAAALDAEADADARRFRSQMEASYKRLRANMSSAYKAERAELRQKHSEHEISALMQRRADKVRTGTLDTSSLEAVERLATASRAAAVAAAAAGGDSQRSALSSTGGSAVAAASTSSAAAAVAVSMNAAVPIDDDDDDDYGDFADFLNSSSSDGEDSDSVATNTTTYDDDDSVSADIDDKPRRARSHQVGTAPVAMKSDRKRGIGTSGERALQRPVSPLVHEAPPVAVAPVVSAAVDWSSDEASEEVVTSMLDELSPGAKGGPPVVPPAPRVESPAPPQPPPPLSEEAEKAKRRLSVTAAVEAASLKPHRKSREKEKSSRKSTSKSTTNKEKTSSSSSSSSKKSKHKEKKDLIVYNPKNDSHSAPKRLGRQVRTIAASATTAPGKLSYTVGEDAVIVEQLSSTWAKARIGDRTGLIKLADVEDVAQGSAATAAAASTTTASTSSSAPSHPAPSAPVPESAKRPSPIITRNRSGSAAYELQRAIAIEQYDAGKHEKAKRDYLKRRARASGVGIDDLAARGTNDASLSTPLFFEAGANILLLSAPEDRPFWQGELDGRIGSFHSSCVRRASTDSPPPPPPPEDSAAAAAAARRSLSKTHGGVISPASASASSTPPQAAAVANLRKKVLRPLSQQAAPAPGSLQSDDESDDASPPPTSIKAVFPKTPPHAAAPSHPLALASTVELGALPGGSGRAMLTKSSPGPRPPLSTTAGTSQARSFPLGSAPAPAAGKVPELKSAPVSPRGGTLESDTGAAAQLGELRACTTALLAAVEQLVKALPDSTIASIPDEIDALAAVCRKTQMRVDMLGASRALTPPLEHGGSLSASTSRVPDDVARRVVFTDDSATATRRSSGSAVPASKKATAGSHLVIGTPVVVPPGSPQLHSSPSRNRRSATAAAGSDVGGTPTKKQGRIGNFLFKFASTKSLDRAIKPTFGLPLRQLVESPVDIPEFVLRGGERLAKLALQEDVLLLGDVDEAQVQALRDVIESGERVDFAAFRAHDIAALLQQFLAELPEPLVSDIGDLLHCHQIDDAEIRDALVQSLLAMLEPWRRALLEFLLVLQGRFERGFPTNTLENFVNVFASALWHVQTAARLADARKLLTFMCERREVLFSSGGAGGEKLLDNDAGIPSLSAGTVDRLILRLLDSNYAHIDPSFANVFFMTHDYFVPAIELANRLIAMYVRCAPPMSAAVRPDSWRVEVASRALLMLQFWLTSAAASHLLADDELLTLVRKFATPIAASSLVSVFDEDTQHALTYLAQLVVPAPQPAPAASQSLRRSSINDDAATANASGASGAGGAAVDVLCQRCRLGIGEIRLATGRWTRPLCKLCAEPLVDQLALRMNSLAAAQWHVFSQKDIADTITQIDFRQLRAVRPQEMLHKRFSDPKLSPNFAAMTQSFNRYSQWVATEVLKPNRPARRATVIVLMLKIATQLRRVYNFHAFFAFLSGLSFSSISRLAQTWAKVPKKYLQRFDEFKALMDANFGGYQRLVAEAATEGYTIIPLLVLLAKRLTAVEENNPTFLVDDATSSDAGADTSKRLANCAKMRMLYRQVDEVVANQTGLDEDITSTAIPELRLFFLNGMHPLSEDDLHKRSLEVEARVPKKT